MKRIIAALLAMVMLCGTTAAADEPDGYLATGGRIIDEQVYAGAWPRAYLQILNGHSGPIHAYQGRTLEYYLNGGYVQVPCRPVLLEDITADGIPELVFIEAANEERADLYIYSSAGTDARCILYVPGIMRLGYDEIGLGYDIYLSSDGGGTLVLEYYEYEWPWILQLTRNASGRYVLLNSLRVEFVSSGEEEDRYYRNGIAVSYNEYAAVHAAMYEGRTVTLSAYMTEDTGHYGFTLDWEGAVSILNSREAAAETPQAGGSVIWGLTIDKLATRKGPGTQYEGGGTYSVKGEYIQVLARAYDKRNGIWWVKCVIPYRGENRILWTGYKRFDHSQLPLEIIPVEDW